MINKKRIAMILTLNQIRIIKKMAEEEGLSFSEKIRRILDDYINSFSKIKSVR